MKRLILFLFAATLGIALAHGQTQPNIYASGLKASAVDASGNLTFSYVLNAPASSVKIEVSNGDVFTTTSPGDLTKGAHTLAATLTDCVAGNNYSWTVTAVGAAASPAAATKISDNTNPLFQFWGGRGVAVDNSFESDYFGRIYASDMGGTVTNRTTTKGVYILDPLFANVTGQTNGFGGSHFTDIERISIGEDGKVYIAESNAAASSHVWIMDPANPAASFSPVFSTNANNGRTFSCVVEGTDIYTFDFGAGGNINQYDITTLPSTMPAAVIYNDANFGNLQQNGNSTIIPDGMGGWWISQYRAADAAGIPCLIHYNARSNTVDYNSFSAGLSLTGGSYQGGMAYINTGAEELLALGTALRTIKVYSVTYNGSGTPTLTEKWTVTQESTGSVYARGIAFDRALNLYTIDNNLERLRIFALPKTANEYTTPAPSSQPVTPITTISLPSKTFTVVVPEGTEHVYIAGDFTTKTWDYTNPFELTATANPNEFEGTFPCVDGVEYYYICGKATDFKEGIAGATPSDPAVEATTPRAIASGASATDVVDFWWHTPKITFNVAFGPGVTVPAKLSVEVNLNGVTPGSIHPLTKSGATYSGSYDNSLFGGCQTNTTYRYLIPTSPATWEVDPLRQATTPGRDDVITGFVADPIAGTYYIPKSGTQVGWASLYEAFEEINMLGISGDVELLIADNLTEARNVGLLNPTGYSITIRPDEDVDRTITFNQTGFDNPGPWGSLCLGIDNTLDWPGIGLAQHITIDGYAAGGNTRRLKIVTAPTHYAGNFPLLVLDEATDITIKNCIVQHVGAATISSTYGIYLRTNPSKASSSKKMPTNVIIENNEIVNTTSGASAQGIGVYADAAPISPATGIVIKDNIITARTRGIFINDINGIDIIGNEIHINQTSGGLLSSAIYANSRIDGTVNVIGNKFIELKSANASAGDYGIKAIVTGGPGTWIIDNNYFTGFNKTSTTGSTTMMQAIRLGALAGSYIRHNTFYLNALSNKPSNTGTGAADPTYSAINIAAGTPVIENNLFVSDEDVCPNYFIRGNANADNNVFVIDPANTAALDCSGTITGTNATIDEVFFADAAAGNLDLVGASDGNGDLAVPYMAAIPEDIHGTTRLSPLTYAGAFEGEEFSTGLPTKTFTVTAPEGTEHVYIAGSFTIRVWNLVKPYELLPTGNPNEFSGTFPASDLIDTEYLYFCEKGDMDYVEAIGNGTVARTANRVIGFAETDATDEIPYWYRMNKVVLRAIFDEGVTIPAQLWAHITDHENTSFEFEMVKKGNEFTGVLGDHEGAKYGVASSYKYYIPLTEKIWEDAELRYMPAPKVVGTITGWLSENAIAGEYYIPKSGEQRGWATLLEAFEDINTAGLNGDVTLLIADDIVSPVNVGLINSTDYAITIRPDKDEDRTITFNQTDIDNPGPWGSLCLGIGNGLAWKDVAPVRNVTIDGYAEGGSTRRLKITTAATHYAGNFPILVLDDAKNIVIKNCIVEHVGRTTTSSTYGIYLRTNPTPMIAGNGCTSQMPSNVLIENNIITNTTGTASQGIGIYADAAAWKPATGIVVKDNVIRARTRGIFVNDINGMEIIGNEFHIVQTSGGLLSSAIYAYNRISGTFHVTGNKFIELKTANTNSGDYGIKAIITGGETSTWYIDNNYFTGFEKTSATNVAMLQGIRLGTLAASYIRHNTFYLNALTNKPNYSGTGAADPSYSAINVAAGTPVIQNNLFVSAEDACANYLIRGNAPEAADNNVFCLPVDAEKAKIATGTVPEDLKTVEKVEFEDAAAGILDLAGTSINDKNLGVAPLEEVPVDIYGTVRSTTLAYAGAFEGPEFFDEPSTPPDGIDTVDTGAVSIVQKGGQLIVTATNGTLQAVRLYDLQGRAVIVKQSISTDVCSMSVPGKGVYIVETLVDGIRQVQKTVVR